MFAVTQMYMLFKSGNLGADAHAYWLAPHHYGHLYAAPPTYRDAYLYAPLFVQALWPLAQLPWLAFYAIWTVLQVACLHWLFKRLPLLRALAIVGLLTTEVALGSVFLLFAVALVVALRGRPEAFLLMLLTKLTSGVGLLWFLVRGEWRALGRTLVVGAGMVGVSVAVSPQEWVDWVRFLAGNSDNGARDVFLRVAIVATIVVITARLSKRWPLAFATYLASPLILAFNPFAVLAATPRLLKEDASVGELHVLDHPGGLAIQESRYVDVPGSQGERAAPDR